MMAQNRYISYLELTNSVIIVLIPTTVFLHTVTSDSMIIRL